MPKGLRGALHPLVGLAYGGNDLLLPGLVLALALPATAFTSPETLKTETVRAVLDRVLRMTGGYRWERRSDLAPL